MLVTIINGIRLGRVYTEKDIYVLWLVLIVYFPVIFCKHYQDKVLSLNKSYLYYILEKRYIDILS